MFISTQIAVLEAEVDEIWDQMEKLFAQRQDASPECWSDIDTEYISLEGKYHRTLDELTALYQINRPSG